MGGTITIQYYVSLVIPVNGRRDYLGDDLRDKLDRRHLSRRRYSPARDARGHQTIRDYSPSRSLEKKSDRRRRRKQGITGQSDISENLRVSDRIRDRVQEGKLLSSGSRNTLEEQLKKVYSDINTLENRKFQLAVYLDESVQEADSLNSRIQELEAQLCREDEECKRITSRIRKFVRVHNHISLLQDDLKRSQVRLQRFGDQLVSDISRVGANEEDLSIDIVSNGENTGLPPIVKHNVEHNDTSSHRKRLHVERDALEELQQDKSKDGHLVETARTRKRSRWNISDQLNSKGNEGPHSGTEVARPLDLVGKHKRGLKESRIEVPSTSMAAHVVDEEVEIELDDRTNINETANTENENGVANKVKVAPLMLPLALIPRSNYSQYEGNDENVDVDGLDEDAAGAHVDIM
ncbi:zinc finger CCCH domain-containing protein 13 isoform X2 [Abrus precatorius]|uniref:Zinc finger CCCH domain-containing protein 13 isoform X2 n=1 Tax=Abrus precatorius TaxID=3816 RepID=A0A8B8KQR2_ABRPR|nr:zinc finger CCCH domain-containing protein 13 isoform X2 [Abrus precatorius]XP_027346201.1 zinc finger CCCH domain-containing protein 13 isoform X2 [Abrus precatorius]XP_027346202.1 zinc finger CCCH domain-containing protein 13 isoform X2 [Abrus precatorius]